MYSSIYKSHLVADRIPSCIYTTSCLTGSRETIIWALVNILVIHHHLHVPGTVVVNSWHVRNSNVKTLLHSGSWPRLEKDLVLHEWHFSACPHFYEAVMLVFTPGPLLSVQFLTVMFVFACSFSHELWLLLVEENEGQMWCTWTIGPCTVMWFDKVRDWQMAFSMDLNDCQRNSNYGKLSKTTSDKILNFSC